MQSNISDTPHNATTRVVNDDRPRTEHCLGETVHIGLDVAASSLSLSLRHVRLCLALSVSSVALGRLYECCFCLGAARRLLGAWRLCPTSADDSILVWRDRHFSKLFFASRPASSTAGWTRGGQGGVSRGLRIGCKRTDADSRVGGGFRAGAAHVASPAA